MIYLLHFKTRALQKPDDQLDLTESVLIFTTYS